MAEIASICWLCPPEAAEVPCCPDPSGSQCLDPSRQPKKYALVDKGIARHSRQLLSSVRCGETSMKKGIRTTDRHLSVATECSVIRHSVVVSLPDRFHTPTQVHRQGTTSTKQYTRGTNHQDYSANHLVSPIHDIRTHDAGNLTTAHVYSHSCPSSFLAICMRHILRLEEDWEVWSFSLTNLHHSSLLKIHSTTMAEEDRRKGHSTPSSKYRKYHRGSYAKGKFVSHPCT